MSIIAERIKQRLDVLKITPYAASLRANRQRFVVRDILSGKNSNPKADLILDLATALVCSADYLLGLRDDPGAAPGAADIDPRMLEALQRVPAKQHDTVRHMIEGVADASRAGLEADTRKKKAEPAKPARKRAKKRQS